MDQIKIGKFIANRRKNKKLTQEELAEKLGISINAVSKWERGLNLPDVSIMIELCKTLDITLNELFAGEIIKEQDAQKQSEKNIIDILKFSNLKNKKTKIICYILLIILFISLVFTGKVILTKKGLLIDNNLKYTKAYIINVENIKGEVDINYFSKKSIDFDIGANKYGYAVFKDPNKALNRLKKDYAKGLKLIKNEFNLLPLNSFTYKSYKTYGWQVTTGTKEEQEQAKFVSSFMDIYENSFN